MTKRQVIRWAPLISFLLIVPCGLDALCIPLLFTLPLGLLAGDLNGLLPLAGICLTMVYNLSERNRAYHIVGTLLLVIFIIKIPYDAGNSVEYVWGSSLTYCLMAIFLTFALVSLYANIALSSRKS